MHQDLVKNIKEQTKIKGMITPCYDGLNLVNISNSILQHFKAKAPNPGIKDLPPEMFKGVKHVVLFLIDGLGYHQLLNTTQKNKNLHLKKIMEKDFFFPLTSVCPSTTATALTSVNTALAPTQHGFVGYNLFLKEFGAISNMMRFKATVAQESYTALGVEAREFFPLPTIYHRLAKSKVKGFTLMPEDIANSGLSEMTHHGGESMEYISTAHMCTQLRKNIMLNTTKKTFTYVYTPFVDTLNHVYGDQSEESEAQIASLDFSLAYDLLENKKIKDTLILITSDHGFIKVNPKKRINLLQHQEIMQNLVMIPTGESRFVSLYVKQGKLEMVKKYCEDHFGKNALVMTMQQVLSLGLLGPPPILQDTADRLGDLILIPKEEYTFSFKPKPSEMLGKHGGLTEEEMLIPLIAKRL